MWIMMICIIATGMLGGGYFVSVSALAVIFLMGVLFYRMYYEKKVTAAWDLNMLALTVLVFAYLIVSFWAVDSGMAILGFVKFLPLLLFYVLVSGQKDERQRMISVLPMLGCLMTVFSFVMMQFPVFKEWVSVAGRLSGFFQYPNTYALFMLVCLIVVLCRLEYGPPDWLNLVYVVAAVFGIAMSGSRTVFILTVVALIYLLIAKGPGRKVMFFLFAVAAVVAGGIAIVVGNSGVLDRFADITLGASTFMGRLLYARDALPLIITHPFGLGYYGYYFIQQSIQTGVYSVVNVHNELLQLFLDVGVIPAVLMSMALLRSLLSKDLDAKKRLVLIVLILHSLFDYDFQFLTMGFVLILFLDMKNVRTFKVPSLTGTVLGTAGAGIVVIAVLSGLSDFQYTSGDYEKSVRTYSGNTLAKVALLRETDSKDEMRALAEDMIADNAYIAVAYSARARAEFSEGDIGSFIEDKLKAIELAPYQYEEYTDYLEILAYCQNEYIKDGKLEDAQICAERAAEIPVMLKELQKKTSPLGWKIDDRPQVTLSQADIELIEEMEPLVDGMED